MLTATKATLIALQSRLAETGEIQRREMDAWYRLIDVALSELDSADSPEPFSVIHGQEVPDYPAEALIV